MLFDAAFSRVALAGRELGSGPSVAVPRIVPNYEQVRENFVRRLENTARVPDHLRDIIDYDPKLERIRCERQADTILLGAAIGLVMAEEPNAMAVLVKINEEWRQHG